MTLLTEKLLLSGLHFQTDGFRVVYGIVALWMWLLTTMFSLEYFQHERKHLKRYAAFTLMTFLATEGVMFSADLMTTFFFFEILSLTSFVWVIHEETPEAIRAAKTYFFIAVIGGLVLFMGLALMTFAAGTLHYSELREAIEKSAYPGLIRAGGICILLGFGAKAGMFPLHIWLPKSHPVAPSPASALLSGILTKVGIFGILMTAVPGFFGDAAFGLLILLAGTVTMVLGALLALFSINLKRTLACSSMSQIGFILVGLGTLVFLSLPAKAHGEALHEASHLAEEAMDLAHSGLVLHMVNHSLIKLALFMAAGVFVMKLGKLDLNEIRGYGRKRPLLMIPFVLGALGISGVPFFNGYLSKTLLHEGLVVAREALEEIPAGAMALPFQVHSLASLLHVIEWIFLLSGGMTFAYMLKLSLCVFVEKNPREQEKLDASGPCMNRLSAVVLFAAAVWMVILGQPAVSGHLAHWMTGRHTFSHFHAFTWTNLKGAAISLAIGALLYLFFIRRVLMKQGNYVNRWPAGVDLEDRVYRPVLLQILPGIGGRIAAFFANNTLTAPAARGILMAGRLLAAALTFSLDALIVLVRKTILRERPRRTEMPRHGRVYTFRRLTEHAATPMLGGFSFAMMMACFGILLILGIILITALRG